MKLLRQRNDMIIKYISLPEVLPAGIDGADVYISDAHKQIILFVGSLYGNALWKLHEIAQQLPLKDISLSSITEIDYACKIFMNTGQARTLKETIRLLRDYQVSLPLDEYCLHNLNVLDAAADTILENKEKYIYIIGD